MTRERRPVVIGNWKMNGQKSSVAELEAMMDAAGDVKACDVMVCPPATLVAQFAETAAGSPVAIGGQDCHASESGAHTGDIAAEMLADAGAKAVIVGHSERRADHGESDEIVRAKAEAAHRAGLTAIICVGETEHQRDAGDAEAVVGEQIAGSLPKDVSSENTIIAYEPVWAIGTGRTPTLEDIGAMHGFIRRTVADLKGDVAPAIRLLYGGSVKPGNAAEILNVADVDGALVGGASLKAGDFAGIFTVFE
jgi:triosephosphate isomerase